MKRRKGLTKVQKKALVDQARFWGAHAGHWGVALGCLVLTLTLLYTFWGNDAAFASAVIGTGR